MTFQYQAIGSAIGSAWTTETDKVWVKMIDRLGLPLYAEIAVANPNSAKETTYDDYQRVRLADGDTAEYIFNGKIESTTPTFDNEFGQILLIRAKDNSQELIKRTINSRYTGFTLRSSLIEQMVIDHSYVNVTKNIDTTTAAKFEDSAVTEAANNLDVDYRKSGKSVLSAIAELAREDPWDTAKTGFSYDYYLDATFSANTPTPFMHYFKRGSRPAGGASANGLTVTYALATETDQARMMLTDYSFSTSGGELVTKVRIEYTDLNGASQNKIVHLLVTSANVGTFTVGETITGAGLPASIAVEFVGTGFLIVTWSSTILTTGGTITGGSSGATRTLDSAPRQTLQQDVEVVLRDYHSEDIDKARARAAELLYKRGDTITRGEFGIIRWPHFTIATVTTIVRAGHVIRVVNSNSSINSDMLVVGIEYDEGPGSFGARLEVIGSARGEGINPGIIEAIKNQTDQGNIQNIGAVGGLPFNAQFCEFTPELNLHAATNQLNGALTDSAITITVDSTTDFASTGTIFIEAERVTYTGKTATTFTGCTRGVDGGGGSDGGATTNVAHDDNIIVVSPERIIWDATTCTYADGRTQAINAGSFTMTDNTAVYWVIETVETAALSVVSGFSSAIGITKHPLAICRMNYSTGKADVIMTHATDPVIATGSLIANQLSAFTADLGKITAGAIKLPSTSQNIIDAVELVGFTGFTLNGDRIAGYNAGVLQVEIRSADGKFYGGAGAVIIDNTGIQIDNSIANTNNYLRFTGTSATIGSATDYWIGRSTSSSVSTLAHNVPLLTKHSFAVNNTIMFESGYDGTGYPAIWFPGDVTVPATATTYITRNGGILINGGTTILPIYMRIAGTNIVHINDVGLNFSNDRTVGSTNDSYIARGSESLFYTVTSLTSGTYHSFRRAGTEIVRFGHDGTGTGILFPTNLTLPAIITSYISHNLADLYYNVGPGNSHNFSINGTTYVQITTFLITDDINSLGGTEINLRVGGTVIADVQAGGILPGAASTYDFGSASLYWQDIFTESIRFPASAAAPAGTVYYIGRDIAADMAFNIPTGEFFVWRENTTRLAFLNASSGFSSDVGFLLTTDATPAATTYGLGRGGGNYLLNVPAGGSFEFRVNGTTYHQVSVLAITISSTYSSGSGLFINSSSTNNAFWTASQGAGTTTMYIGNVSITTSSDIRLKKDIMATSVIAYDLFKQLKVVDYTWDDPSDTASINKNSRGRWTGLVAQEMIDVVPWIVNAPDRSCLTCRSGAKCSVHDSYWSVDLQHMAGLFVKGFQETDIRIQNLEREVERLRLLIR